MKPIHIENVLILVNLILILYLVYVLSNRTIEKFYHEDIESPVSSLDPSVPDFEPHTHRDSTITPINDGCGNLCESGRWTRPSIPSIVKLVSDQDAISITDNTLTISNITLNKSINHPFYDLWYIEIGILPHGETWKDISININDNIITRTRSQDNKINEYNLNDVFSTDGTLKDDINIDLNDVGVTNNFHIYLGILDENYRNPTLESLPPQNHVWNRFTFYRNINYTPCAVSNGICTLGNDCCGDMVCYDEGCQQNCPVNYYSDDNGVCVLCPENEQLDSEGICVPCPDGHKRASDSVGICIQCEENDYTELDPLSCSDWLCEDTPPIRTRSYNTHSTCGIQELSCDTPCTSCPDSSYVEVLENNCSWLCDYHATSPTYEADKKENAPKICPEKKDISCPRNSCYRSIEGNDVRIEVVNTGGTGTKCLSKNLAHSSGDQQNDIGLNSCGSSCGQKFHASKIGEKWIFTYKENPDCTNDSHDDKDLDMANGMKDHHWGGKLSLQNYKDRYERNFSININNTAFFKQDHNKHPRKLRNYHSDNYYLRYDGNNFGSEKNDSGTDANGSTIYFREYT